MITLGLLLAAGPSLALDYLPPRCPSDGDTNIGLFGVLYDEIPAAAGRVYVEASGFSALASAERIFFAEEADQVDLARAVLAELEAGAQVREELLADALPILDSPWEVVFEWPLGGPGDHLARIVEAKRQSALRDSRRRAARLSRLTVGSGASVLALDLGATSSVTPGLLELERRVVAVTVVETADRRSKLVSIGKRVATGARLLARLAEVRSATVGPRLLVHPGDLIGPWATLDERELCGRLVGGLGPDALVPREGELSLPPDELRAFAARHGLGYLAANLYEAGADARLFPRYRVVSIGGVTVAFIGAIAPDQLVGLPAASRSRYRLTDPRVEISAARDALERELGRVPDLTVVLLGADPGKSAAIVNMSHVDVVFGDFETNDLIKTSSVLEVDPAHARERVRFPDALLHVPGSFVALGRVGATFTPGPSGLELRRLTHAIDPIGPDGPVDRAAQLGLRRLEEERLARQSSVVLPDVTAIVDADPELAALVFGDHIPHRGRFRSYARPNPPRLSDPLWMRFVTRAMLAATGADVALSRCPRRAFDLVGPLSRTFVEGWLETPDALRYVELSGAELGRILDALDAHERDEREGSAGLLYAAGLDRVAKVVRGRPIDPKERYRVVLTDYVAELSGVRGALGPVEVSSRFEFDGERARPVDGGEELSLRKVTLAFLERFLDRPGGRFDPAREGELARILRSNAREPRHAMSLRVDELAASVSTYTNTENVSLFAASRETRVTTPSNTAVALRANVAAIYDGPALAVETRAVASLQRLLIELADGSTLPQEQADDLVLFTELRMNFVELDLGGAGIPIVPFARFTLDTEFTPTPNPSAGPEATFPHQRLVFGAIGLVAYPSVILKELRVGGLTQADLSTESVFADFGITLGYRLAWPIHAGVTFESEGTLRWLPPDDADRASDLELYLAGRAKLVVPIMGDFALFAFADGVGVKGKVEQNRELGGSVILGAGFQVSRVFRLF